MITFHNQMGLALGKIHILLESSAWNILCLRKQVQRSHWLNKENTFNVYCNYNNVYGNQMLLAHFKILPEHAVMSIEELESLR